MRSLPALLVELDGKMPNLALMRLAAHLKKRGEGIVFRRWHRVEQCHAELENVGSVYGSAIFERTRPVVRALQQQFPHARIGGTGVDLVTTLESAFGVSVNERPDYSIYPDYPHSIGFSQRGCRLKCSFCVVPRKEGPVSVVSLPSTIWRGDPWPRNLLLLDNDFFGQPNWQVAIDDIRAGGFRVSFNQGINVRFITEESAAAIASVDYRDDSFRTKRIYTAWDNQKDERRVVRGLELLVRHGIQPQHILVYMLVGYWPNETATDRDYRRRRLREFGALPYPMPYVRTRELVGFQRWVVSGYDMKSTWAEFVRARFDPHKCTSDISKRPDLTTQYRIPFE